MKPVVLNLLDWFWFKLVSLTFQGNPLKGFSIVRNSWALHIFFGKY
jgi:hypothetical protein